MLQSLFRPVLRPIMMGVMAVTGSRRAWSPLALWPDGISTAGMWISPSTLPASFNDYTGTTPVATPGSVADSTNPVGLALDIRAGAPGTLGPELVTNGDFSDGTTGWIPTGSVSLAVVAGELNATCARAGSNVSGRFHQDVTCEIGKTYQVSLLASVSTTAGAGVAAFFVNDGANFVNYSGLFELTATPTVFSKVIVPTTTTIRIFCYQEASVSDGTTTVVSDNISVREVPGNHMLQASTTARPLESARTNNFASTEDLNYNGGAVWYAASGDPWTTASKATTGPDGSLVDVITTTAVGTWFSQNPINTGGQIAQAYVKLISGVGGAASIRTIREVGNTVTLDGTWQLLSVYDAIYPGYVAIQLPPSSSIGIYHPQANIGSTALPYQRVGADSDYDSTGITPWQLYDGTDDGMATANVPAGTFIDGTDCMIAVRRDSAANCIAGLYKTPGGGVYIGACESSGAYPSCAAAGTPTVWVDGTQLAGGTAVTAGTLAAALTVGDWHIMEFRNLNLFTWTAAEFGSYTSYAFNGARGDIMLYPSTASTEDKDAARQYLADLYGVTLA